MDEKRSAAKVSGEELHLIGYLQDFKIANRYSVLSEGEEEASDSAGRNQFNMGGSTTLLDTNPEASVLPNIKTENQDSVAQAPGEDKVPTSLTEDEHSTWTKVSLSNACDKQEGNSLGDLRLRGN